MDNTWGASEVQNDGDKTCNPIDLDTEKWLTHKIQNGENNGISEARYMDSA